MQQRSDDTASTSKAPKETSPKPKRRNLVVRILKWGGIAILSLLLLLIAITGLTVWILTPDRLTPLVNRYGSEYITGEIKASRVELTFWSTFPRVTLDVDSLRVISRVSESLPDTIRTCIPVYSDTLLSIDRFNGGINLVFLSIGRISLSDITIDGMKANVVQFTPTLSNYDIVPADEVEKESSEIPDISLTRFVINGETPIRFFSLPDSVDLTARLTSTTLDDNSPLYHIHLDGKGWMAMANQKWLDALPFGLNGAVRWSAQQPSRIGLEGLEIGVGNLRAGLDAVLDFKDILTLHEFSFQAKSLKIKDIIDIIPPMFADGLQELETDISFDLGVMLKGPFRPMEDEWPTVEMNLNIPGGSLTYDRLQLNTVKGSLKALINGSNPDASSLTLDRLTLVGRGVGLAITGEATNILTDPDVRLAVEGGADFSQLPRQLLRSLPFTVRGHITTDCKVSTRASYLTRKNFHRIYATGNITLEGFDFAMRDSSMSAYARKARLRLGTSEKITTFNGINADSLLTASAAVDTLSMAMPELIVAGKNLTAGVGMRNVASSADTTVINPVGLSVGTERLTVNMPADTMSLKMKEVKLRGVLKRYSSDARRPHLILDAGASSIRFRDKYNRVNLRDAAFTFNANTKSKPKMSRRVALFYDSIAAAHPRLRRDSVLSLARREARKSRNAGNDSLRAERRKARAAEHANDLDLSADRSIRRLLTWWEASGKLTARRGSLFTPYLPLRNRINNLDITFSTDSVVIHDTRYRLGGSDFLINGIISNIESATTSRRGNPLKIDFSLQSDTININQISKAIFAGSAFAEKVAQGAEVNIADTDSDEEMQKSVENNANPDDKLAFIVPSNIEANLSVRGRNVLYADIWAHRLTGNVAIANGRVNIQRFAAFTAMGSIDLTALYTAPNYEELSFAGGLVVRKLNLEKFLHMLPQIDSIMPLLREVEGIITAEMAMTTELDSLMDLRFHTLNLAMKLSGDSLVFLDSKTFKTVSKWLLFKRKDRNMIDQMSVEMAIKDSHLDLYPFVFDFDRYKLGVSGGNDFEGNYDYHIAVLHSPIPFKFGVTVKGHGDHFKVRLGKARFNENAVSSSRQLTDTTRINLMREIESVFKFGVRNGKREKLILNPPVFTQADYEVGDTLSRADSLLFIKEGVLEAPPGYLEEVERQEAEAKAAEEAQKKSHKRRKFHLF